MAGRPHSGNARCAKWQVVCGHCAYLILTSHMNKKPAPMPWVYRLIAIFLFFMVLVWLYVMVR